jgi:phytoene dehydrogenase-like protein
VLSVPIGPEEVRSEADAARLADRLTAAAESAGMELDGRVLWREVRTPRDVEAETGVPGGLVPAPALAGPRTRNGGADVRTPNKAALQGLYRVGGWAHPGGGLPHAGMSGALAAGLVVEGDDWRGSY